MKTVVVTYQAGVHRRGKDPQKSLDKGRVHPGSVRLIATLSVARSALWPQALIAQNMCQKPIPAVCPHAS